MSGGRDLSRLSGIPQWRETRDLPALAGHSTVVYELDTVLGSNLSKYITPELGLEFSALKEHLGIDNFA